MFANLWEQHRKGCKIAIGIAVILIFIGYFYAMFQRGVWHRDAFLYRQDDGTYRGSDQYAEYVMEIIPGEEETQIIFQVNGGKYIYRIAEDAKGQIQIYDNDRLVFQGRSTMMGDTVVLISEDDGMLPEMASVVIQGQLPALEDLLPGNSTLYSWATMHRPEPRGNFAMVVCIVIGMLVLLLDINFPNLFWILEHRLSVDGGEPSDWYRTTQKFGRVIVVCSILVFMIMSFTLGNYY